MSLDGVVTCDLDSLTIEDIIRMVTVCDEDGNFYFRVCDYSDEYTPHSVADCVDCGMDLTVLNILKKALSTDDDGNYCLNIIPV